MMKELKLEVKRIPELQNAVNMLKQVKLKGKPGSFRAARVISLIQQEVRQYSKRIDEIIKECGEPRKNGVGYWINPDNPDQIDKFNKIHGDYVSGEVTLKFIPIDPAVFEGVEIPFAILTDLMDFFHDDATEPVEKERDSAARNPRSVAVK